jgi:hypothetical protein
MELIMPITRSGLTTTSKKLPNHADGNSLPVEVEAAAGLLISMRRNSTIGQAKSAASAKRQREVRSPEVRPASRQRIAIDLTSDKTSPRSWQTEPALAEPRQPAVAFPAFVVRHTPIRKASDFACAFSAAIPFDLKHHIQTRGVNAAVTEGKFKGWNVLHIAAFIGDLEILHLLQNKKLDIVNGYIAHDAPLLAGATPLEAAICGKQAMAVKYLASIGADVGTVRTQGVHLGLSPLHLAAMKGDLPSVQALLDTLVTNPHEPVRHPKMRGHTAVSIANALDYKDILCAFSGYDAFMEANADFKTGASLLARYSSKLS